MQHTLLKLATLACLAAAPTCGLATEAAGTMPAAMPAVQDVALASGGLLRGQVVDAQGVPMKATPVGIWFENRQVATVLSDETGRFDVAGLRGGVHHVSAGQGGSVYRLWTAEAAPPSARPGTIVVSGQPIVRGQNGQPIPSIVRSPILWGILGYTTGHIVGFNSGIDRTPSSP